MSLVKSNYNGELNSHQLFDGAIKGMVEATGDPYTVYLNQKGFSSVKRDDRGYLWWYWYRIW